MKILNSFFRRIKFFFMTFNLDKSFFAFFVSFHIMKNRFAI